MKCESQLTDKTYFYHFLKDRKVKDVSEGETGSICFRIRLLVTV